MSGLGLPGMARPCAIKSDPDPNEGPMARNLFSRLEVEENFSTSHAPMDPGEIQS